MADSVQFSISCTPIEVPTVEEGTASGIMASEVGKSLGGSGAAVVADFGATGALQGYKDAAAFYLECVDNSATQISAETTASFVFIKNTGKLFSSTSVLGAVLPNSEHIVVTTDNTGITVIASLAPGEALILKALQSTKTIDCTKIKVQTFESNGGSAGAADHIAVEFLVVD